MFVRAQNPLLDGITPFLSRYLDYSLDWGMRDRCKARDSVPAGYPAKTGGTGVHVLQDRAQGLESMRRFTTKEMIEGIAVPNTGVKG